MMRYDDEKGLTLVELLATIVILAIVVAFVTSILVSSQKQNVEQTASAKQLANESYSLKVITKDIRRALNVKQLPNGVELDINGQQVSYINSNNQLVKNPNSPSKEVIADNIGCFQANILGDSKIQLSISLNQDITDCANAQNDRYIQKTTLQLRKGDG